jgi:amino acid transporter
MAALINTFGVRALPALNTTALFWSLIGMVMTIITVVVTGKDHYQPAEFVFRTTISETGWPTGVSWILGLLQSAFALTAFDSVMHLAEEVPHPEWNCPIAMVAAIGIGAFSGFSYLTALLFSLSDYSALLTSPNGALLEAYYQATSNRAGATCLQVICIGCQFFACTGAVTAASRVTWSFARDNGLPFSKPLSKVARGLDVPLVSIIVASAIPIAFGAIYIGSTSALNAILSSSVVFLNISYGIPSECDVSLR